MTPIEPMTIEPQGEHGFDLARVALIVAVLASLPWIWMLHQEREQADKLLVEATAASMRVDRLTIRFSNGAKSEVAIREKL